MQHTRRQFLLASASLPVLLSLGACGSLVRAPGPGQDQVQNLDEMLRVWGEILSEHVDDQGRVNFAAAASNPTKLLRIVRFIESEAPHTDPDLYPTQELKLAYHLNAYNALSLYAVIAAGIPRELDLLARLRFFKLNTSVVGGQAISLFDYENKIIRKLKESRIHFALNCMSVGCPRLPRFPFTAANMNQQLHAETKRFFAESRNLRIDDAARTVYFSEILKFYTEDFLAEAPSLAAYATRYTSKPVPGNYAVKFTPYDWTINRWPNT
jgi:hypothetical protein